MYFSFGKYSQLFTQVDRRIKRVGHHSSICTTDTCVLSTHVFTRVRRGDAVWHARECQRNFRKFLLVSGQVWLCAERQQSLLFVEKSATASDPNGILLCLVYERHWIHLSKYECKWPVISRHDFIISHIYHSFPGMDWVVTRLVD